MTRSFHLFLLFALSIRSIDGTPYRSRWMHLMIIDRNSRSTEGYGLLGFPVTGLGRNPTSHPLFQSKTTTRGGGRSLSSHFTNRIDSISTLQTLRGGGDVDIDELVGDAYDWCNNLGAPAALVAGAVIATLYENIRGGQLELHKGDTPYIMAAKKLTNMLFLSAFAMQIVSIFVTTVLGGVLRSYDFSTTKSTATSGLAFLKENYEFEFLTTRLSFLQGLLNWLAGVAVEYTIPRKGEGQAAKKMDHFVAISLATLIILLLSFYNSHLTFYDNYFHMLRRWLHVTAVKYFESFRPMMILYIPGILLACHAGVLALQEGAYSEERDD